MQYKDFFLHLQESSKSKESQIQELAEEISERLDVSVVQALSKIKNRPKLVKEWKTADSEESKESLLKKIKDSADAPSVGEEVKVKFDEASRGFLTPRQKEANGSIGTVQERQEFKTGSQFARYTVKLKNEENVVYNLTPGEVVPTSE